MKQSKMEVFESVLINSKGIDMIVQGNKVELPGQLKTAVESVEEFYTNIEMYNRLQANPISAEVYEPVRNNFLYFLTGRNRHNFKLSTYPCEPGKYLYKFVKNKAMETKIQNLNPVLVDVELL